MFLLEENDERQAGGQQTKAAIQHGGGEGEYAKGIIRKNGRILDEETQPCTYNPCQQNVKYAVLNGIAMGAKVFR
jgi:hypothetical protein